MSNHKNQYSVERGTGLFMVVTFVILLIIIGSGWVLRQQVTVLSFNQESCYIEESSFDIKWLHSVEKQWWIERYQVRSDDFLLTDTYMQTFGAGTPSTETIVSNNSKDYPNYIQYRIQTSLPYLNWMVSHNIKAHVIITNGILPVYNWVDDYTTIYFVPKKLSLWQLLLQESCYEHAYSTK
ncbi:MAG: DUF1850 domain-containing protein [Psychrobacter sp.]|uniref:DUF1850 domain-containing protein n=1 Tax=unclassified Psychrobacter TaxID=196806 RepID=UPI001787C980|nr:MULTISPECIES: DUF1850 domain-containing protein [unclassified Psychrobacter]MBE0443085.1 DUF1850 domain-containing protein [Psychrobacter sp. FME13]